MYLVTEERLKVCTVTVQYVLVKYNEECMYSNKDNTITLLIVIAVVVGSGAADTA